MDYPLKLDNAPSWKQVFTPVNVSILSSVGLHAFILGLALPNLPFWERTVAELDTPPIDTVGVIELTEAERSRLPEPAPLPDPSAFFSGAPSPTGTPNPALPPPPGAPLPNTPPLPPSASALPSLPSLPSYPPNLPPLSSYGTLRNFPIVNPPLPSLPALRSSRSLPPRLPAPPGALPAPFQETPTPPGLRPQFGTLPPPRGTDFITRAPRVPLDNGGVPALPEPQMEDYGIDTPLATARDNDLTWQAKRGVGIKERIALTGPYPPIACRNRTSATVVFNADGQGNTDLISASRYPIFNQLARQVVSGRSFTEPTQISVNFNYDPQICGALGAPAVAPPTAPATPENRETPTAPRQGETLRTPQQQPAQPEAPSQPETAPAPERAPAQESETPPPPLPQPQATPPENQAPTPQPPAPEPEQQSEPPQSQPSPEGQSQPAAPGPQTTPGTETAPTPPPLVPFGAESKQDQLLRQQRRSVPPPTPQPAE